jgi:2'-5' RNA ligase
LCPVQRSGALHALADDCVTAFDAFRRAPEADELARRRVTQLSARQEALLERFGYPYVLEEFRFHMTLTERLAPADAHHLKTWLARFLSAALREPAVVDAICLFVQERPGGAFRITDRFAFGSV